ncbi:hypothetical protein GWI33_005300 [Rhynchophorus ferrugineus]|uniref:Nucleolar protein 4 n=1 Tax=Rhynchophorus ferrugineus TaxID=354439 RepID=A0A834IGY5_RHYFE|nr:hypothetical protein GWI33_005300 [Rhynchophorus ferrugineus]
MLLYMRVHQRRRQRRRPRMGSTRSAGGGGRAGPRWRKPGCRPATEPADESRFGFFAGPVEAGRNTDSWGRRPNSRTSEGADLHTVNGEPVYRKVAVVENFFDIIYNVHVELEGKPGKHAGQKRTYRTITETYAFLPREAVTRFLLGCIECQKRPRSVSPASLLPTPSPSPTSHSAHHTHTPTSDGSCENLDTQLELRNSPREEEDAEKKEEDPPGRPGGRRTKKSPPKESPKLWSPVKCIEEERDRRVILPGNIDYSMPITTTYLKYMKSLGCKEEEALNFNSKHLSVVGVGGWPGAAGARARDAETKGIRLLTSSRVYRTAQDPRADEGLERVARICQTGLKQPEKPHIRGVLS